ncbi:MAG: NUDIX domain-containing protein [Acidimicrobiia bacterium]|nr:NUDIX domain-containing protein [Acidimicrobiia bacterium]MDH5238395.1 NUDIX domain-containing protein [Acidimicrobiia bacterium]MDH5289574.1 NUDIX domain-containing protein [Acidimicrobiia bacterium]
MSWAVSVKGLIGWGGEVVLLRNERNEWELPGGQPDATDPTPEAALGRELDEELGLDAQVGPLLSAYRYDPVPHRPVLILVYRCWADRPAALWHSDEHGAVGLFGPSAIDSITLPDGYRKAIELFT